MFKVRSTHAYRCSKAKNKQRNNITVGKSKTVGM